MATYSSSSSTAALRYTDNFFWVASVIIGVSAVLVLVACIDARIKRDDYFRPMSLISATFNILDLVSDIFLTLNLLALVKEDGTIYFPSRRTTTCSIKWINYSSHCPFTVLYLGLTIYSAICIIVSYHLCNLQKYVHHSPCDYPYCLNTNGQIADPHFGGTVPINACNMETLVQGWITRY